MELHFQDGIDYLPHFKGVLEFSGSTDVGRLQDSGGELSVEELLPLGYRWMAGFTWLNL